ncbi:MAG: DUF2398 family protein [Acidimicrobiia bacterium]|nr:DUF2398 family protein [Acidimicrobiia bacterium]
MAERPHRVAADVSDVDLAAYQQVVRLLLVHPLVTDGMPGTGPDPLARVRRWEDRLRADLDELARYHLEVTPSCARLLKRPLPLDGRSPLRTRTGRPWDRRRYAYLCLALAVPATGGVQVIIADLADRVRRLADDVDELGFDPTVHAHRVALVDVLRWLESTGALALTAGTTDDYVRDPEGDALDDVDHDVAPTTSSGRRPP